MFNFSSNRVKIMSNHLKLCKTLNYGIKMPYLKTESEYALYLD